MSCDNRYELQNALKKEKETTIYILATLIKMRFVKTKVLNGR